MGNILYPAESLCVLRPGDRQIGATIDLNFDVIINPDTILRDKQDYLQSFLGGNQNGKRTSRQKDGY